MEDHEFHGYTIRGAVFGDPATMIEADVDTPNIYAAFLQGMQIFEEQGLKPTAVSITGYYKGTFTASNR